VRAKLVDDEVACANVHEQEGNPVSQKSPLEDVSEEFLRFWQERHLSTLTTVRRDGTPHVAPVGVTLDVETATARVISASTSHKVRQIRAAGPEGAPVAVCQVDGRRWSTLQGRAVVRDDPDAVIDAERRYEQRYKKPRPNPSRVVIEISVTKILGTV
jgi:F420H(2)-dependent biliverdin reductase